jgi:hypothetical protein
MCGLTIWYCFCCKTPIPNDKSYMEFCKDYKNCFKIEESRMVMEICQMCKLRCKGGYVYKFYKCSESGKVLRRKTEKELERSPRPFDLYIQRSFEFTTNFCGFNFL